MKKGIHPEYDFVVFRDNTSDQQFVCRSTKLDGNKLEHEGQQYPSVTVEVSAYTHPFYTGKQRFVDTEGRVEKFQQRFGSLKGRGRKKG
jgi:large subunit ribosomal protein L31